MNIGPYLRASILTHLAQKQTSHFNTMRRELDLSPGYLAPVLRQLAAEGLIECEIMRGPFTRNTRYRLTPIGGQMARDAFDKIQGCKQAVAA
jgi:DNA-binding HxlR family transcriptional regulator